MTGNAAEVLIVDDNALDREALRRALKKTAGGRELAVREAETGRAGLALIRGTPFSCVFLDNRLPDMEGTALLRELYDPAAELAASPVVMLTGQGSEAVMLEALRWGVQDYIVKEHITPDGIVIAMAKARELFELRRSRRRAEEQLQLHLKMEAVGQLTSGVAHDFNNLLTVVLGNLHLLRQKLDAEGGKIDPAYIAKKIQSIETVARNGAELVKRLMVFTRQRPLAQSLVNVGDCVRETSELLKRSLGDSVEIRTELPAEAMPAVIDAGEFGNALINLAVNARDAMPLGGRLTIEVSRVSLDEYYAAGRPDVTPGSYVLVAVSDTGAGISPDVMRRIFEPFFTTKPAGKGTGLGLAMVYGFVRQSGGHVTVYSEEHKGTVFKIYLPAAPAASAAETAAEAQAPAQGEIILVAEDDDEVRGTAVSMLEALGYRTLNAKNGRTALELLRKEHGNIALVFTDIGLPGGIDGIELVAQTRVFCPGIKALFTTGYTAAARPGAALPEGGELIGKPYRKDSLGAKVREILGGKGKVHG
jgi:signal transduction histidine kinase